MDWPERNASRREPGKNYCNRANSLDLEDLLGARILSRIQGLELHLDYPNLVPLLAETAYDVGRNVADLTKCSYIAGVTNQSRRYWTLNQLPGGFRMLLRQTRDYQGGFTQISVVQDSALRTIALNKRDVSASDQSYRVQRVTLPWPSNPRLQDEKILNPFHCRLTAAIISSDRAFDRSASTRSSFYHPFGLLPMSLDQNPELPDDHQEHSRGYIAVMGELCRHLIMSTEEQ